MVRPKKDATQGLNGALAGILRGELAERGMRREDLAEQAGIPIDSLKNYLSTNPSRARVMDLDVVSALAEALGTTAQQLIARAENRVRANAATHQPDLTFLGPDGATIAVIEAKRFQDKAWAELREKYRDDLPALLDQLTQTAALLEAQTGRPSLTAEDFSRRIVHELAQLNGYSVDLSSLSPEARERVLAAARDDDIAASLDEIDERLSS